MVPIGLIIIVYDTMHCITIDNSVQSSINELNHNSKTRRLMQQKCIYIKRERETENTFLVWHPSVQDLSNITTDVIISMYSLLNVHTLVV